MAEDLGGDDVLALGEIRRQVAIVVEPASRFAAGIVAAHIDRPARDQPAIDVEPVLGVGGEPGLDLPRGFGQRNFLAKHADRRILAAAEPDPLPATATAFGTRCGRCSPALHALFIGRGLHARILDRPAGIDRFGRQGECRREGRQPTHYHCLRFIII